MARVILTGSTGFVGKHVLETLLGAGHQIFAPVRFPDDLAAYRDLPNLEIAKGSFYDSEMLQKYQLFQPDVLIHLAAIKEGSYSRKQYNKINVQATEVLVEYARNQNLDRFIYCSTVGIYGTVPDRIPADAWTPASPDSEYQRSKFRAEKLVLNRLRNNIPFVVLRPTAIYGEGDAGFTYKLAHMVRRRRLPLLDDQIMIHLLDVESFAELIALILVSEPDRECIINIADENPVFLSKLADLIHEHFHNSRYPGYLQLPPFIWTISQKVSRLIRLHRLNSRLKRIANSWYYDTSNLEKQFDLTQKNTLERISLYLQNNYFE